MLFNSGYVIMNLFRAYILCRLMEIYFGNIDIRRNRKYIIYLIFYPCITIIHLINGISVITLISNLIVFSLLSLNYTAKMKYKFISVSSIFLLLLCPETVMILLRKYIDSPIFWENYYNSIFGMISILLFTYMVVLILQNYVYIRKGNNVPVTYWITILLIPTASTYILTILFISTGLSSIQILICVVLLLIVNIYIFSLNNTMLMKTEDEVSNYILLEQNNYYENQLNLIDSELRLNKSFQHDWRNHLSIVYYLYENNEEKLLIEYISEILKKVNNVNEYVHTGNVVIDSILNYKLQEANNKGIKVILDVYVPEQLSVKSFDITVILGNLLDNAIDACSKLDEKERNISLSIHYDKSRLFIDIKNQYKNEVIYNEGNILSTKHNKLNHGIGLSNVKNAVEKYQGLMDIEHTGNTFSTLVLLFV